jgi:hypothetical protein
MIRGLLAEINSQKHLFYLQVSIERQGLGQFLVDLGLQMETVRGLGIDPGLDDRSLWNFCQAEGWVLFTDDRNDDGPDSLQSTMNDSWRPGLLPILTPSRKQRLEFDRDYRDLVANHVAELLIDIASGDYRDQPRIYVPLNI